MRRSERQGGVRAERLFREANEAIAQTARSIGVSGPVPFICECSDPACRKIVVLSLEEYGSVRTGRDHLVMLPGHDVTDRARVVTTNDRFVVVESPNLGDR